MKIGYLVNQYPKVSHTFIRREIHALERQGFSITRFSVRDSGEKLPDVTDVREHALTRRILEVGAGGLAKAVAWVSARHPGPFARALAMANRLGSVSERSKPYHAIYLAEACVLFQWCQEAGIEHLHVHFGTNSTEVALLCRMLGGPSYSFTAHGPEEWDKPSQLGFEDKVHHAAFAVTISDFGRSQLYRWCKREDWGKVHVVRCGLDESFLDQQPTPVPSAPRIVNVGRLNEQKGQLLLIEALGQLKARGLEFELVLVGDGELRAPIEARLAELNLGNNVSITGWVSSDRVKQELLSSRALVLPSFAEGLPIVLMESLALGRPVVTTRIAGIPELVDDSCGWVVAPGSVAALVDALSELLSLDSGALAAKGEAGAKRVRRLHDARTNAVQLGTLIRATGSASVLK
jgi:colanic acid/amylovoran biosynthesis glycosyltransferase